MKTSLVTALYLFATRKAKSNSGPPGHKQGGPVAHLSTNDQNFLLAIFDGLQGRVSDVSYKLRAISAIFLGMSFVLVFLDGR